jgi:RNA polymerase-binding transcription factor DksA
MAKNHKSKAKKAAPKPAAKKAAPAPSRPSPAKGTAKKPASAKSAPAKSAPAKPTPAKPVPVKPAPAKLAPAKSAPAKATPVKPAANGAPAKNTKTMEKPSKKTALRDSILKRKAASKPIAFSLDEVRAIAQTVTAKTTTPFPKATAKSAAAKAVAAGIEKAKPQHVKAASLADILGFNPKKGKPAEGIGEKEVPEKFKRYYKLLIDLRTHLTEGIERHSEETLKRSAKDDAGDLSAYGQHMADAGTDTFDRDFALSMVASEQEALSEIDAAIKRIHDGSYGICEISQKPIAKERLLAVPFTRHSAEAQKDLERNRHRTRTQAGLFGELGEEGGGKIMDEDGGDE